MPYKFQLFLDFLYIFTRIRFKNPPSAYAVDFTREFDS